MHLEAPLAVGRILRPRSGGPLLQARPHQAVKQPLPTAAKLSPQRIVSGSPRRWAGRAVSRRGESRRGEKQPTGSIRERAGSVSKQPASGLLKSLGARG